MRSTEHTQNWQLFVKPATQPFECRKVPESLAPDKADLTLRNTGFWLSLGVWGAGYITTMILCRY